MPDSAAPARSGKPPKAASGRTKKDGTRTGTRIQFDLPPRTFARLVRLKGLKEAVSYAEVVRDALAHEEVLIDAVAAGGRIVVERKDGSRTELLLL